MRQEAITASKGAAPVPEDPAAPVAAPPIIGTKPKKGEGTSSGGPRGLMLPLNDALLGAACGSTGPARRTSGVMSTREPLSSHKGSARIFADPKDVPDATCACTPAGL
jgi:hypothetical protein